MKEPMDCVTGNLNPPADWNDVAKKKPLSCRVCLEMNKSTVAYPWTKTNIYLVQPLHVIEKASPETMNPFATTQEFVTINQKLAGSVVEQSLRKCQPEIFTGDVTLFHPWKSAFKAMIEDADVSPEKEVKHLQSHTKEDPIDQRPRHCGQRRGALETLPPSLTSS